MVETSPPKPWLRPLRSLIAAVTLLAAIGLVLNLTGCMESMFYYPEQGSTPAPTEFTGAEKVVFQSDDGTRLTGWFIPSQMPAAPPDHAATILHAHGNAGNITSHIGFTEYLPAAGFNLLIFDYRGYGESDGSARRRGDLIADTDAAVDYLLSRNDVDHDRIGMYGQSLGGSIGLNVMRDRPEIRAAVIESAFTSWRDVAANAIGGAQPGPIARFVARVLIRDGHRPIDAIAEIDRPMLILHGTADAIVPITHGRALAEASPAASLVEWDGGEHNSLRWTHPEVEHRVIEFFRTSLSSE